MELPNKWNEETANRLARITKKYNDIMSSNKMLIEAFNGFANIPPYSAEMETLYDFYMTLLNGNNFETISQCIEIITDDLYMKFLSGDDFINKEILAYTKMKNKLDSAEHTIHFACDFFKD